jgi:hypothetical protein
LDEVEYVPFASAGQVLLENGEAVPQDEVFVHKQEEKAEHETVFVPEPVLTRVLQPEAALHHLAQDLRLVAEVFVQVAHFAGKLKPGPPLLEDILPVDFGGESLFCLLLGGSAEEERVGGGDRPLSDVGEGEALAVQNEDHLARILDE